MSRLLILIKMKMKRSLFTEDDKKQAEAYKENSTKSELYKDQMHKLSKIRSQITNILY